MQRTRLLKYFLIVSILVMAAVVSWQMGSRPASISIDRASVESSPALLPDAPAAVFELAALEAYDEIIERPLFSQTRRPPVPETVKNTTVKPPQPKNEPLPDWKLVGTAITSDTQTALIWDTRNRRFVRLEPGMNRSGWEIAAVQPEVVVMSNGKIQHQIKLPRF